MQGVNSLHDLKAKLVLAGFEIESGPGWYVDTVHGRWDMAHGVIYLDGQPIKNIADAPEPKKKPKKKSVEKKLEPKKPEVKKSAVKVKKLNKKKKLASPKKSDKSKKHR